MKDRVRKLWDSMSRHLGGIGITAVLLAMVFTVAKGAAGGRGGFDPGEIDTDWMVSGADESSGKTGYDLSGEGTDGEEVSRDSGEEKEEEPKEEEGDQPELLETGEMADTRQEQVILPEGSAGEASGLETVDTAPVPVSEGEPHSSGSGSGRPQNGAGGGPSDGSGQSPSVPGGNGPSGGNGDRPQEGPGVGKPGEGEPGPGRPGEDPKPPQTDQPIGGTEPPTPVPEPDKKYHVVIGGKKESFDSIEDALIWMVDQGNGTDEDGKYFEGFIKDEDGNLVPSYVDQDKFSGSTDQETSYGYDGDSEVYVVPPGSTSLDLTPARINEKIKTIVIHKSVTSIIVESGAGEKFPSLEKFVVSGENPRYFSVDGVLYQREGDTARIRMIPPAKKELKVWPAELVRIESNSFDQVKMDLVELPDTVAEIQNEAFSESSVGTIVLPESVRSIGSMAFAYADPPAGEKAAWHRIIVKGTEPPKVTNTTFYWMDYNLERKAGDPTTEILVPDSDGDQVYEAYLTTWGMSLSRRYGSAALQILKTESGAEKRYEYYEENGKKGFRRIGETSPFYLTDQWGVYRVDEAGRLVLMKCTSDYSVVDLSQTGAAAADAGAFDGCPSMTGILLPESLEAMPEGIFAGNEKLKVIVAYGGNPPVLEPGVSLECGVFVKPEALRAYQDAWGGQVRRLLGTSDAYTVSSEGYVSDQGGTRLLDVPADTERIVVSGYSGSLSKITSIYDGAMAGHEALTSVVLQTNAKVERIGAEAFAGCTGLTRMTIPEKVTEVCAGAFAGCTNLTGVTWQTAAEVPESCFEGCTSLQTFAASGRGHNLTAFGDRAFKGCAVLGTVLYYSYASNGTNYYYYYFLERVGEEAFSGCGSMTYAYLHTSVKDVGARAFEKSGLTQTYWYTGVPVSEGCFKDCTSLKTVGWGSAGDVTAIGGEGFYRCISLETLFLPESVVSVGDLAFGGRDGALLTLTLGGSAPPGWGAVDSIQGLTIYVPDSEAQGDAVYKAYLDAWKDWLGDRPGEILKTEDNAQERVFPAESGISLGEEPLLSGEISPTEDQNGPDKDQTEDGEILPELPDEEAAGGDEGAGPEDGGAKNPDVSEEDGGGVSGPENPGEKAPSLGEPDGEEPGPEEPGGNETGPGEPGTEGSGGNEADPGEPGTEEPGGNEAGPGEPGTEEPGGNEAGPEESDRKEPGSEKPGESEPGGREPGEPAEGISGLKIPETETIDDEAPLSGSGEAVGETQTGNEEENGQE